jgi:hypothetical protein
VTGAQNAGRSDRVKPWVLTTMVVAAGLAVLSAVCAALTIPASLAARQAQE